uniref:rRNA-processing protein UTP23 homolog n=2 Tax=Meloidogyne TaxID=189290 RepID=A0A914KJD7_MELIC
MKVKRLKRASRVLTFFRYKFGYIPPYSILLDGTFCQEALKCKINLREQLPKYLRDENLEMFVTECVLNELEQLGKPLYGALCIAQQFKVAKCPHRPLRSAADCIAHLARRSQNSEKKKIVHYFVATQDSELLQKLRILGGIPLMLIRYNAILLEKPSEETEKLATETTTKNPPDEIQKIKQLRKIELGEGEEPKHRKRKAKGPNPLSCKKKKKIKKRNLDGSVPGAFGRRKKEGEEEIVANNT